MTHITVPASECAANKTKKHPHPECPLRFDAVTVSPQPDRYAAASFIEQASFQGGSAPFVIPCDPHFPYETPFSAHIFVKPLDKGKIEAGCRRFSSSAPKLMVKFAEGGGGTPPGSGRGLS